MSEMGEAELEPEEVVETEAEPIPVEPEPVAVASEPHAASEVEAASEPEEASEPEAASDVETASHVETASDAEATSDVETTSDAEATSESEPASELEADGELGTVSLAAALGDDDEDESLEMPPWLEGAIEAIAFCSSEPVTVARVRELISAEEVDLPAPIIRRAFKTLVKKWAETERVVGRGITLVEVGGGVLFRTAADQGRFLRRMFVQKPQKLSRAALETLAIVAYRQPLTRPQIDEIRGVDSSAAVKALLDKKLLRVLGKADDVGRPLLYGTTKTFLEFFGLASLRDLPTLKEYHELKGEGLGPELTDSDEEQSAEDGPKPAAIVMDLFNPEKVGHLVSDETQLESDEALSALEQALGKAMEIAKRTSDPHAAPAAEEGADDADEAGAAPDAAAPAQAVATGPDDVEPDAEPDDEAEPVEAEAADEDMLPNGSDDEEDLEEDLEGDDLPEDVADEAEDELA